MNTSLASTNDRSAADIRRQQILEATLRVVGASGVDGVRHRRVAAEADLPLGSITYYFSSRDDLIGAAFEHFLETNTAFITGLWASFAGTSIDDVVDFIVEMVRLEFASPERVLAEYELILYAARKEALGAAFRKWERDITSQVAEVLERLGASSPFAAARTLMELVRGFEVLRLVQAHPEDELRDRLRQVLAAAVAGGTTS